MQPRGTRAPLTSETRVTCWAQVQTHVSIVWAQGSRPPELQKPNQGKEVGRGPTGPSQPGQAMQGL